MKLILKKAPDSKEAAIWAGLLTLTVLIGLGVLLVRQTIESSVLRLATLLPVGYAFGAGMVASVNPCGFFMLPAYVAYYLGLDDESYITLPLAQRLGRSMVVGGITSCGFMVVFGVLGFLTAVSGSIATRYFPETGLFIGVGMVGMGIWLLLTRGSIGIMAASRVFVVPKKTAFNVFSFGMAYAVASLSCTLPIFLVVVGSAFASNGIMSSLWQFSAYALGMSSVLIIVTISAAFFRSFVISGFRRISQYSSLISSLLLILAGSYIIYYWVSYGIFA
jgi:cytochrome c biogenesis protein CcdA